MKNLVLTLAILVSFNAVAAEGPKKLLGDDAKQMAHILKASGLTPFVNEEGMFLTAFDLMCIGNGCFASAQDSNVADSRVFVPVNLAEATFNLLKKAGFKSFVSDLADGSAGRTVIGADTVKCAVFKTSRTAECDLN
jgi:hypothetical protein